MDTQASEAPARLKPVKSVPERDPKEVEEMRKTTDRLLSLAFMLPNMRGYLNELSDEMFVSDPSRAIFVFLNEHPDFDGSVKDAEGLTSVKDYVKILSLQFEELYSNVDVLQLQYEAVRLRTRLVELFVKDQKKQIRLQMDEADDDRMSHFLGKVRDLDQLLNRTKE